MPKKKKKKKKVIKKITKRAIPVVEEEKKEEVKPEITPSKTKSLFKEALKELGVNRNDVEGKEIIDADTIVIEMKPGAPLYAKKLRYSRNE